MKRAFSVMLAGAFLAAMGATASAQGPNPLTLKANPVNNSGQSGTVTLTPMGTETQVIIAVTPSATAPTGQAAVVHSGSCAQLGAAAYPLGPVVNGKSTTTLGTDLSTLESAPHAIVIHESIADQSAPVACTDIAAATGGTPAPAAPGGANPTAPNTGTAPGATSPTAPAAPNLGTPPGATSPTTPATPNTPASPSGGANQGGATNPNAGG